MDKSPTIAEPEFLYDAFISYRHVERDRQWAQWLLESLENYRVPRSLQAKGLPPRLRKIFRDEDEMPASGDLNDQIKAALQASKFLIVVCSPYTPRSKWVEREIQLFNELGRSDNVLVLLTEGEPHDSFPSAILERHMKVFDEQGNPRTVIEGKEPLAADVRPRKDQSEKTLKELALLRLAACILGVKFDELRQRELARQRKRQRIWAAATAMVMLVLGAGGYAYRDYNQPKSAFFRQIAWRYGVPEGVGPIDEETRTHRQASYRVVSQRGRVVEVRTETSSGDLRAPLTAEDEFARWVVIYRENGPAERVAFYNGNNDLAYEEVHKRDPANKSMIVTFERNNVPMGQLAGQRLGGDPKSTSGQMILTGKTEITRHERVFDANGFVTKIRYQDFWGTPRHDAQDSFGKRLDLSPDGLVLQKAEIGPDGADITARNGVRSVAHTYDDARNIIRGTSLGADGKPVAVEGYAAAQYAFDRWGNRTGVAFLGEDSKPVLSNYGIARNSSTFDAGGNLIERAYFGVDDKPVLGKDGFSRWVSKFDARGYEIEQAYFDTEGKPTLHKDGYWKWTAAYDDHGRRIEWAMHGIDGKAALHRDGFAIRRSKYDDRGNTIEYALFGTGGAPILQTKLGFARRTNVYDERGNLVEAAYFGVDGKPILLSEGHAGWKAAYDARGNQIAQAFFGLDGEPKMTSQGFSKGTRTFDTNGNLTEVAYFGIDGKPVLNIVDGVARLAFAYDERGNRIEQAYFGLDGKPVLHREGNARWTAAFDARGNATERAFFGLDGKPAPIRDGFARVANTYDARGNRIETSYFGVDGKPVLSRFGHARIARAFDARGNLVSERYFGTDGQPILRRDGYAGYDATFDLRGNQTSRTFLGVDGRPRTNGHAKVVSVYDPRNNFIEESFLDPNGKPVLRGGAGYAKASFDYNARDRQTAARYLDADGKEVSVEVAVDVVLPGSVAAERGIAPGDRVLSYNGEAIFSVAQLQAIFDAGTGVPVCEMTVRRKGESLKFSLPPGRPGLDLRPVRAGTAAADTPGAKLETAPAAAE